MSAPIAFAGCTLQAQYLRPVLRGRSILNFLCMTRLASVTQHTTHYLSSCPMMCLVLTLPLP